MGTPHAIRQRQYAERQRARGLRLRRLWLSDEQTSVVRSLLHDGPGNGRDQSSAEIIATQEALRQAQSDLAVALSRIRALESRQSSPPPQALARIHDLEVDIAQLSRVNAALRAQLSDAQRAARICLVGLALAGLAVVAIFFL